MTQRGSQETTFTNLETSGQTSPEQHSGREQMNEENEQKKKPGLFGRAKLVIGLICVTLGVAVVIFIVVRYHKYEKTRKSLRCLLNSTRTVKGRIKFGEPLYIDCKANFTIYQIFISFTSTYDYISRPEVNYTSSVTNISEMSGDWNITLRDYTAVLVRNSVKCDSDGTFTITISSDENNTYTGHINVEIESKVSQVKLEVGRSDTTADFYNVSCSTGSQCTQTAIMLLGNVGNQFIPLYGVNFTCIINYNDEDGWSVTCTGSIPDNVINSLNGIMCRLILNDQVVVKNTEVAVSKDSFY